MSFGLTSTAAASIEFLGDRGSKATPPRRGRHYVHAAKLGDMVLRFLRRLAIVFFLMMAFAALLLWKPWDQGWTDQQVESFLISCTENGLDTKTCRCVAGELQDRMSAAEFQSESERVARENAGSIFSDAQPSHEIRAAFANCRF